MKDAPQPAFRDQLFGQGHGWDAAVVEADHARLTAPLYRFDHGQRLRGVHGQGFFADDPLAGCGSGQGDGVVGVVGRADVDHVDVVPCDQALPVGFDALPAPARGEGRGLRRVCGTDCLEDGAKLVIEELVDLAIGVGMGSTHEARADQADVECAHGVLPRVEDTK